MLQRALDFRNANTAEVANYADFQRAVEKGFALAWWCGSGDCEAKIKEETKATMRCIPLDQANGQANGSGKCVYCGETAKDRAIFAKAY